MPGRHIGVGEIKLHSLPTSAKHGGEWSASHTGRFTPRARTPLTTEWEAEWASYPIWTFWIRENILPPPGFETRTVQPIA